MIGKEGLSIENIVFGERGLNKTFNMTAVMANDYLIDWMQVDIFEWIEQPVWI